MTAVAGVVVCSTSTRVGISWTESYWQSSSTSGAGGVAMMSGILVGTFGGLPFSSWSASTCSDGGKGETC